MYIFPTYLAKRNFRSHFLCKFLRALANKICDVMWGWEISTWRTEHINYLPKSHHVCNLRCIWLYVLFQKYPRIEFFHQKKTCCKCSKQMISTEMDAEHSLCSSLAERWKLFCLLESFRKKIASSETLMWRILYLFPCSGNP